MFKNLRLSLILMILCNDFGSTYRVIKLKKAECIAYEPYVNITCCQIRPISRHLSKAYGEVYLKKDYKNGIIHAQVFQRDTVDYKPFLVNVTMNTCDILKRAVTNFYASFVLREVQRISDIDFSRGCPVKAGKYQVWNYTVDDTLIRNLPIPLNTYKIVANAFIEDKNQMQNLFDIALYVELYENRNGRRLIL